MKLLNNDKFLSKMCVVMLILLIGIIIYGEHIWSTPNVEGVTLETTNAPDHEENELQDKVLVAFGDSVTEFGNYPDVIAKNSGLTVYNVGFGGTRMAYHTNSNYDAFSMTKLVDAIVSGDYSEQEEANAETGYTTTFENLKNIDFNNVNIITIMYGTNDYMGGTEGAVPLGTRDDSTRETFNGAMNYIVKSISEAYPEIEIVFITPTWRMNAEQFGGGGVDTQPNPEGIYMEEYVDAIIEFANNKYLPVLDLFRSSGIKEDSKEVYLSDTVHPTYEGYELIGNKISVFLNATYNK